MGKHDDPKGGTGKDSGASPGKHASTRDTEAAASLQRELDRAHDAGIKAVHLKLPPQQ